MRSSISWLKVALGASGMVIGAVFWGCASGGQTTSDSSGSTEGTGGRGGAMGTGGSGGAPATATATSSTSASSSTTSATGTGGMGGQGGSGGTGGGGGKPGLGVGSSCNLDVDCASGLCKPVLLNSGEAVCVIPCTQQSDCGISANLFCDPITAGSVNGYCVPHSPAHCLSCSADADCGSLSEACFLAPGDKDKACHVDCAISGETACPAEYTCTDEMVNGQARKLCRPNVPTCLDAVGGFCDRIQIPQPCTRANATGSCLGQRDCLPGTKRFDTCNAAAPQCKADCSLQDPPSCTLSYCPGATTGPGNCGMCGKLCPGYLKQNDNVACNGGATCAFSCQGENFDVDNDPNNGCEIVDAPIGNHTQNSASAVGSISCNDGNGMTVQIAGKLVSDKRVHEMPAVNGFDAASGSAPDWYNIFATGGVCTDDITLTFSVQGSASPTCYKMLIVSSNGNYTCQAGANGSCAVSKGSGSYQDDTTLLIEIQKTCNTNTLESVNYTIVGHL